MLERLFTSKTRIRILTLLLFSEGRDYHLREIARLINVSPIYASKELANLEKINLVLKKKKANLSLYSINNDNIFLYDIKNIFLKTDFLGNVIINELGDNAEYCFIYGSFAKGTENENSDIDLFVVSGIHEDELLKVIQRLERKLGREINYILWNEKIFKQKAQKGHHLLRTINKEKIIMLIGDENEFRRHIK